MDQMIETDKDGLKMKDNELVRYLPNWLSFAVYGIREGVVKTVPYNVWKLNCVGFAWSLNMKAALSLGL